MKDEKKERMKVDLRLGIWRARWKGQKKGTR
jgi:hypothetical protein